MTGNTRHDRLLRAQRWRLLAWGAAGLLLITPWVAMQFTSEVRWKEGDFVVFAVMLGVLGGGIELALRLSRFWSYRAAAALGLLIGFATIWINGAVGIIGDGEDPRTRVYEAVVLIAFLATLAARFRAAGMVWAMRLTALAQLGTVLVAMAAGVPEAVVLSVVFSLLWLLAAWLFGLAARQR